MNYGRCFGQRPSHAEPSCFAPASDAGPITDSNAYVWCIRSAYSRNQVGGLVWIFIDEVIESHEYFHLLFDKLEIIFSEGAPTESLYTSPEALKDLSPDAREEILLLFPEIADLNYTPKPARQIPPGKLQKLLIARHAKNNQPLTRQ